jgi:hypothetical protein
VQAITESGIGVIIVGSLFASYGEYRDILEQSVNYFYDRPCFDVKNDREAYSFFENIIKARSAQDFIQESAIENLIEYSGGVLRDLINLTQAAIEEAYLSDSDTVEKSHVQLLLNHLVERKFSVYRIKTSK